MSYYEKTAFELPISFWRYAIAMVLKEDLLSRRDVWAPFLQEVEEKMVGDGTSDLLSQVCVCQVSPKCACAQGWVGRGKSIWWRPSKYVWEWLWNKCRQVWAKCPSLAKASATTFMFGWDGKGLTISVMSSLAALIWRQRKVLLLMSFPSLGCCSLCRFYALAGKSLA